MSVVPCPLEAANTSHHVDNLVLGEVPLHQLVDGPAYRDEVKALLLDQVLVIRHEHTLQIFL